MATIYKASSTNRKTLVPMKLGQSLGLKVYSMSEAIEKIRAGLPIKSLETFRRSSGLQMEQLVRILRIAPRTFARRKVQGRLSIDESERLIRLGRVLERTLELVGGNLHDAREWLSTPAPALGGQTPLDMTQTEIGAEEVMHLIGRLEHGVFT